MDKTIRRIQTTMEADRAALAAQIAELDAALAALARYRQSGSEAPANGLVATTSKRRPHTRARAAMTAAQRVQVSRRMKAYWRARKAKGS